VPWLPWTKIGVFSHGHPPIGDEQLGKASALRRDIGKEEPRGVLSSAGSKEGSFRASKCHHEFHGCLDKHVPVRSEILSQELKDIEQKSQFHPVSKPFSSHVHLIFIQ
jgi:hypothetical protein